MFDVPDAASARLQRMLDFMVLSAALYVSCKLLSVNLEGSLLLHMLAYSTILLGFVRLSKRAITSYYKSIGESTRQILGNAIGILIGTSIVLLFEKYFSNHNEIIVAIILSSVIAFFVLGTFGPLVKQPPLAHK